MQILTIDVGTGTQDIYLYDARLDIENGFKLVVPSPTMMVHQRLKEATRLGTPVLLSGVTMGGGPSQWAAEAHVKAGFPVYATPEAARTFNDELELVESMGIRVLAEDETASLPSSVMRIELRDLDFSAIARAFGEFGVSLDRLAAVAVAVFDHGNAPAGYSDRQFRFDYLDERLRHLPAGVNPLSAFAFKADQVPNIMTRLQAVVKSAAHSVPEEIPLVVMDTAPAAVLGALFDPMVAERERVMIANVGNFHTLAFCLGPAGVEGIFEHHTGLINLESLEDLLIKLADGSLRHEDVFSHHGHGALIYETTPLEMGEGTYDVAVTGPRRNLFNPVDSSQTQLERRLRPYFAVPFGDMMLAGCFGLLAATADILPDLGETIRASLHRETGGSAPWD